MKETAENFKEEYELDLFMETSAKTGVNAQEIFIEAAKLLYADFNKYKEEKKKSKGEALKQGVNNDNKKNKKCCS